MAHFYHHVLNWKKIYQAPWKYTNMLSSRITWKNLLIPPKNKQWTQNGHLLEFINQRHMNKYYTELDDTHGVEVL